MTLLFATTNSNKLREVQPLFADLPIALKTLADVGSMPEPDETGTTFWANARLKAFGYAAATGLTVVAEDSGLEIAALAGEPGVTSARFLGPHASYPERFAEISRRLGASPRDARFVTALAVVAGPRVLFEAEAWIDGCELCDGMSIRPVLMVRQVIVDESVGLVPSSAWKAHGRMPVGCS
jgi:XTP/dITP diphosphohydrolase